MQATEAGRALLLVSLLTAWGARAQPLPEPPPGGALEVGLGVGYAFPFGEVRGSTAMGAVTSGAVPLEVDLGLRVVPEVTLGLFGQAAPGIVKSCPLGLHCSIWDYRVGFQGVYHVQPAGELDPWVGVGVGYELFDASVGAYGAGAAGNYAGLEFASLHAGCDYRLSKVLGVGPVASASVGEFTQSSGTVSYGGTTVSATNNIPDRAAHFWLDVALRVLFDF